MTADIVGVAIREARRRTGLNQKSLAQKVGVSPAYMNLIENGRRNVNASLRSQIADALKIPETELIPDHTRLHLDLLMAIPEVAALGEEAVREFSVENAVWRNILLRALGTQAELEKNFHALGQRLSEDNLLETKLHGLLSRATSIRSTASILNTQGDLPAEMKVKFRDVVHDEARVLSEQLRELVEHLEGSAQLESEWLTLDHRIGQYCQRHGFYFSDLESGAVDEARLVDWLISQFGENASEPRLQKLFSIFLADIRQLPMDVFMAAREKSGWSLLALAHHLGEPIDRVMRRLPALATRLGVSKPAMQILDQTGCYWLRTSLEEMIWGGEIKCPFWPIFDSAINSGEVQSASLCLSDESRFDAHATRFIVQRAADHKPERLSVMISYRSDSEIALANPTRERISAGIRCADCRILDCANRRIRPTIRTSKDARENP